MGCADVINLQKAKSISMSIEDIPILRVQRLLPLFSLLFDNLSFKWHSQPPSAARGSTAGFTIFPYYVALVLNSSYVGLLL